MTRDKRLIPARAGNTASNVAQLSVHSAHPRSRGEHRFTSPETVICPGSSPLARGTQSDEMAEDAGFRLIPARAGNTTWPR